MKKSNLRYRIIAGILAAGLAAAPVNVLAGTADQAGENVVAASQAEQAETPADSGQEAGNDVASSADGQQTDAAAAEGQKDAADSKTSSDQADDADQAAAPDGQTEEQKDSSGEDQKSEENPSEDQESEDKDIQEEAADATEISDKITEVVTAITDPSTATNEAKVEQLADDVDELQSAIADLSPEAQELLSNSKEVLDKVETAVDTQQEVLDEIKETGTVSPSNGEMNSFRFLNGTPVNAAIEDVETEKSQAEAVADGVDAEAVKFYGIKKVTARTAVVSNNTKAQVKLVGATGAANRAIDVSQWQGHINWSAVKASGITCAIIRCGYSYRGATHEDPYWRRNASECERLGIPYGVYYYSMATNNAFAQQEANFVLQLLTGLHPSLPVFDDIEDNVMLPLDEGTISGFGTIFCDTMARAGHNAGVYASKSLWEGYKSKLGTFARNTKYYHWIAQWYDRCTYSGTYSAWQYSDEGSVSGINGAVDLDYWYGSLKLSAPSKPATTAKSASSGSSSSTSKSTGRKHATPANYHNSARISLVRNGIDYSTVFDPDYYLSQYPDLQRAFGTNQQLAFNHFLRSGMREGRDSSPAFNVYAYANRYPDLQRAFGSSLPDYYKHYARRGVKEQREGNGDDTALNFIQVSNTADTSAAISSYTYDGVDYSPVFDSDYYLNKYPDLRRAFGTDRRKAFNHFLRSGMREGRIASPNFNVSIYKARYRDLQRAFGNDLRKYYRHYIRSGIREGRSAT